MVWSDACPEVEVFVWAISSFTTTAAEGSVGGEARAAKSGLDCLLIQTTFGSTHLATHAAVAKMARAKRHCGGDCHRDYHRSMRRTRMGRVGEGKIWGGDVLDVPCTVP